MPAVGGNAGVHHPLLRGCWLWGKWAQMEVRWVESTPHPHQPHPHPGREPGACRVSPVPAELYGKVRHVGVTLQWKHTFPFVFQSGKRAIGQISCDWQMRASRRWYKIRGCKGEFSECKAQGCHYGIETWTWTSLNLSFRLQIPFLNPLLCSQPSRLSWPSVHRPQAVMHCKNRGVRSDV